MESTLALFFNLNDVIMDSEEGQTQLTKDDGENRSVKEEVVDTRLVKNEVGDGEMYGYEDDSTGEEPGFDEKPVDGSSEKKCPVDGCTEELRSSEELKIHLREHPKPLICGICKRSCPQAFILRRHYRSHSGEKPFQCEFCEKMFSQGCNLYRHRLIHTGQTQLTKGDGGTLPVKEEVADISVVKKEVGDGEMWKYEDYATGEEPGFDENPVDGCSEKKCPVDGCPETLPSSEELTIHLKKHPKPLICDICKRSCPNSSFLCRHYRTHTGERPFKCEICEKTFTDESSIARHRRVHKGYRYACGICSYETSDHSCLKKHQRNHTGEKLYTCIICEKSFRESSSLTVHMRIHTGERPYACDACGFKTTQAGALKTHQRIHTGEKPYSCSTCGFKSAYKYGLDKHKKKYAH